MHCSFMFKLGYLFLFTDKVSLISPVYILLMIFLSQDSDIFSLVSCKV